MCTQKSEYSLWKKLEQAGENKRREIKRKSWYKSGKNKAEAVFFVKATPGGKLKEKCKEEFSKAKLQVKERTSQV